MAENNNISWAKLVITIAALLVTFGIAWATVRNDVDVNTKTLETIETRSLTNERDIIRLQSDIKYIREGVDEIKKKL